MAHHVERHICQPPAEQVRLLLPQASEPGVAIITRPRALLLSVPNQVQQRACQRSLH